MFYRHTPSDDIAIHMSKVEGLCCQLKQLGEPMSEPTVTTKILTTLAATDSEL